MRINVIGTSGTGKTTLARKLAKTLSCEYIEMDKVFWLPNWEQPSDAVFLSKIEKAVSGDRWVLDGNYGRSTPIKWKNIEMVVWLDYSFSRTLFQACKRALARAVSRKELWEGTGNRESFARMFGKESIIWWTITTHGKMRTRYESYMTDSRFSHIRFVRLQNHRDAEKFLKEIAG